MAERIKVEIKPRTLYPWKDWMDGCAWQIEQGKDFAEEIPIHNFVNAMHAKARKKGMKLKTNTEGKKIKFQFYKEEDGE